MVRISLVMMFLTIFNFNHLSAAEVKEITLASDEWEKQTQADDKGAYYELLKAAFEPEYKVKFIRVPWARASSEFRKNAYDVLIAENKFDAGMLKSEHKIDTSELTAFFNADFKFAAETSLKTSKLTWVRAYNYEKLIPYQVNFQEVDSPSTGFKLLHAKRADIMLDYEVDFETNCKKAEIDCKTIKFAPSGIMENTYLAFHDNELGKKLKEHFDKKMAELIKAGTVQKIYKSWGADYKN